MDVSKLLSLDIMNECHKINVTGHMNVTKLMSLDIMNVTKLMSLDIMNECHKINVTEHMNVTKLMSLDIINVTNVTEHPVAQSSSSEEPAWSPVVSIDDHLKTSLRRPLQGHHSRRTS